MIICGNCGAENPPQFRLCPYCGTALAAAPPQEVRKTVTVLFSDLVGSTSLGEQLDPETLREVLNRYFAVFREVLERHGAVVEKYSGDAVMAVFGIPEAHEDDALRAVRAAREMQGRLGTLNNELERGWGVRLNNRTGVNTGEVITGESATRQRLVTGDAVNVAARLEQAATAGEVLLGGSTYRLARDFLEVEALEPLALKGKSEPVAAYRLAEVRSRPRRASTVELALVGRDAELGILVASLNLVSEARSPHLVSVVGEAGVGKSRLLDAFKSAASATVIEGRCLAYGEGITFWPLTEAIHAAAEISEADDPQDARTKLAALLGPEQDDVEERIAALIGLSTTAYAMDETFWGVRRLLELVSRREPLVLVIHDIHWAEPPLLDLLEHVLHSATDAPVLMVTTARPDIGEVRPAWAAEPSRATRISLGPLGTAETSDLISGLLPGDHVPDDVRQRIVAAAEGNPLFVEQLVSMLVDDGMLVQSGEGWAATRAVSAINVPPSVNALLAARIDRLQADGRGALERGSVIGQVFYLGALEHMTRADRRPWVGESLESLINRRLVSDSDPAFEGEPTYRFQHGLIRDTAYAGLLKRARAELHESFVDWLEDAAGSRALELEEIVGYHLEQAYEYRVQLGPLDEAARSLASRGADKLASAGRRALGRGDIGAAAKLLQRAFNVLPPDDPRRLDVAPDLSEALADAGEFDRAEAVLDEALEGAGLRPAEAAGLHVELARLYAGYLSDPEGWRRRAEAEASRAVEAFERLGDRRGLIQTWMLLAMVHGTSCRYAEAEQAALEAFHLSQELDDERAKMRSIPPVAMAALYGPTPVGEGIRRCEEALESSTSDRRAQAMVLCTLSHLRALHGEFDAARELYGRARALFDELGGRALAASTSLDSGRVELLAGDFAAAERELRGDYDVLTQIGEQYLRSTLAALLGFAVYLQGRPDDALELSALSEQLAAEDDVESQVLWRRLRARILAERGELAEAERLAREAVAQLRDSDGLLWQAQAQLDLGHVLGHAGRTDEQREAWAAGLRLFEQKEDRVSAARLRQLMEIRP